MGLRFVLCFVLLAGCSGAGDGDGDAQSGNNNGPKVQHNTTEPSRTLMLSTTVARLGFGERLRIRGALHDKDDAPVEDELVSFALVGLAQDSSLEAIDARTDAQGMLQNALVAGQHAATFRVRASAPDARAALIDVVVSDAGFGSLLVSATYGGERMVAERTVFAHADGSCSDARTPRDPAVALSELQKQARLPALPAGVEYAVTAVALSAAGTLVARGCVDGVRIETDADLPLEIALEDVSLMRAGEFALDAELDTTGPASVLSVALANAAGTLIVGDTPGEPAPDDAEARFLLDTLDDALREGGDDQPDWVTLADALAVDRADDDPEDPEQDTPDHGLQAVLEIEDKGPLLAIERMAQLAQEPLEQMRLTSTLVLLADGSVPLSWEPLGIETWPRVDGAPPLAIDLTQVDTATSLRARFLPARDAINVARFSFHPHFGALAARVLERALQPSDDGGGLESLRDVLGCPMLVSWLAAQHYAGACDGDCVVAACDRALGVLRREADAALNALDKTRPTVKLAGELVLRDADGDLVAETMTCDVLAGEWSPENDGGRADVIAGDASAAVVQREQ